MDINSSRRRLATENRSTDSSGTRPPIAGARHRQEEMPMRSPDAGMPGTSGVSECSAQHLRVARAKSDAAKNRMTEIGSGSVATATSARVVGCQKHFRQGRSPFVVARLLQYHSGGVEAAGNFADVKNLGHLGFKGFATPGCSFSWQNSLKWPLCRPVQKWSLRLCGTDDQRDKSAAPCHVPPTAA